MRRVLFAVVALASVLAACSTSGVEVGGDGATGPTGVPGAPDAVGTTGPGEPPSENGFHVALVELGDELNVRVDPDAGAEQVGSLEPDPAAVVEVVEGEWIPDGDTWVRVASPTGEGWANAFFLTPAAAGLPEGTDEVIDRFAELLRERGDLSEVASPRGIFIWHYDDPERFDRDELRTIATDETPRRWGGVGCSPEECPEMTFMEAIGGPFLSVYDDEDRVRSEDGIILGPNGLTEEAVVPFEFRAFHHVLFHDPNDEPEFEGLDWMSFYVYVEPGPDGPWIAALSVDMWGP